MIVDETKKLKDKEDDLVVLARLYSELDEEKRSLWIFSGNLLKASQDKQKVPDGGQQKAR